MSTANNQKYSVSKEAAAGAAVYTKFTLFFYDMYVMLFENRFVFKCPTKKIIQFYNNNMSNNHLDVGVGTGYFLDKCVFSIDKPIIHLMDLNINSLTKTSKRIKRYDPVVHQWNIYEPIKLNLPKFDSICISNLLHCLPGDFNDKETVFKNLKPFLKKNGSLFGLTILGKDIHAGLLYTLFNKFYNRHSIFSNLNDTVQDLEKILNNNFKHYKIEVTGSVALFNCKNTK